MSKIMSFSKCLWKHLTTHFMKEWTHSAWFFIRVRMFTRWSIRLNVIILVGNHYLKYTMAINAKTHTGATHALRTLVWSALSDRWSDEVMSSSQFCHLLSTSCSIKQTDPSTVIVPSTEKTGVPSLCATSKSVDIGVLYSVNFFVASCMSNQTGLRMPLPYPRDDASAQVWSAHACAL